VESEADSGDSDSDDDNDDAIVSRTRLVTRNNAFVLSSDRKPKE
jgi:hypothetical protein